MPPLKINVASPVRPHPYVQTAKPLAKQSQGKTSLHPSDHMACGIQTTRSSTVGSPMANNLTPPKPRQLAKSFFKECHLSDDLRRLVRRHLKTIAAHQVTAYTKALHALTVHPSPRAYPLVITEQFLRAVVTSPSTSHTHIVPMALELTASQGTIHDRLDLFVALADWPERLIDLRDELTLALKQLPNHALRLKACLRLPAWEKRLAASFPAYLRCMEPLWPLLQADDFKTLEAWDSSAHKPSKKTKVASLASFALTDLDALDDCALEDLAREHEDLEGRDLWQRMTSDNENIMRASRHFATHAAVKSVFDTLPLAPPDKAVAQLLKLYLAKLTADVTLRTQMGISEVSFKRAIKAWSGPRVSTADQSDQIGPLSGQDMLDYLGDHKMPVSSFVAFVWLAIHNYHEADSTWNSGAPPRELMRASLLNAFARIHAPTFAMRSKYANTKENIDKLDVTTERRCQVGVSQELMTVLASYYPFSIDMVTPQDLLSTLAQHAFGHYGDNGGDDGPDDAEVMSFYDNAQKRAQALFGNDLAPNEGQKSNLDVFYQHLHEYLAWEFDFVVSLPKMAAV